MLDRALIFLDLETTGATAQSDRITEIGLVEVDKGRHIGEWSSLVNPERAIPPLIESLTGITDAMVAMAPTFADLAEDLYQRLAGKTLVAHNARFDFGFLQNEFRRVGLKYAPDVLCTVRLSRRLFPQERRHNLDSLIERHGLTCDNRHRALADARVLWDFTQRIHQYLETIVIHEAVADQLKKPQLPPGLPADLPDRIPEAPGVYAFYSQGDVALHVGKSANLRARVLSHFSGDKRPAWRGCAEIARVEWDVATGELGMQIRHMQWLKRLQPLHYGKPRHDEELWALHALRMQDWPHPGPIGIRERDAMTGRTEIHVLDRWRHLGTADAESDLQDILQTRADVPFDASIYKILVQYFKSSSRNSEFLALG
jgi:DNA polymerase-3 subunit epsilon